MTISNSLTARWARLERLYGRLNVMACRAMVKGDWERQKRIDRAMSMVGSIAYSEGCREEWV